MSFKVGDIAFLWLHPFARGVQYCKIRQLADNDPFCVITIINHKTGDFFSNSTQVSTLEDLRPMDEYTLLLLEDIGAIKNELMPEPYRERQQHGT